MVHEIAFEKLNAMVDGEVEATERLQVQTHIASCAICAGEIAALRALSAAVVDSAGPIIDVASVQRIHEALRFNNRRRAEWFAGVLAAIAACIVVASGLPLLLSRTADVKSVDADPVPAAWETEAVIRQPEESSAGSTREVVMSQWLVSNLNTGTSANE